MRVTRRVRRDERGAVLIIVAAFVIVAVVFLAFVIDIGNQRQDRRQLTTATDASALDVAKEWLVNGDFAASYYPAGNCTTRAQVYLDKNRAVDPGAYNCDASRITGQLGTVSVFADGLTDYRIAPAIGVDQGSIGSTSSVRMTPVPGGGLRPFAVCAKDSDELNQWLQDSENGLDPGPTDVIIGGPKFLSPDCGQNNANWGFVQYPSQAGGTPGLTSTLEDGTEDAISSIEQSASQNAFIECHKTYALQDPDVCLFQDTGTNGWNANGPMNAFQQLKDDGTIFNLPVYDAIQDLGGGKTGFPIKGFLEVQLLSFCDDNAPTAKAQALLDAGACAGGNDNFVHVLVRRISSGDCCDLNADNTRLEICDVGTTGGALGADFASNCQTGGGDSGGPPIFDDLECEAVGFLTSPNNPKYNAGQGQINGEFSVSATVLNESECDVPLSVHLISPDGTTDVDVTSGYSTPTIAGSLVKNDPIWQTGTFTIEVRESDGTVVGSAEFIVK